MKTAQSTNLTTKIILAAIFILVVILPMVLINGKCSEPGVRCLANDFYFPGFISLAGTIAMLLINYYTKTRSLLWYLLAAGSALYIAYGFAVIAGFVHFGS